MIVANINTNRFIARKNEERLLKNAGEIQVSNLGPTTCYVNERLLASGKKISFANNVFIKELALKIEFESEEPENKIEIAYLQLIPEKNQCK